MSTDAFSLRRRSLNGGTRPLSKWGFRNETDTLTDVLLGSPAHLFHRGAPAARRGPDARLHRHLRLRGIPNHRARDDALRAVHH